MKRHLMHLIYISSLGSTIILPNCAVCTEVDAQYGANTPEGVRGRGVYLPS